MSERREALAANLSARFGDRLQPAPAAAKEIAVDVHRDELLEVCTTLRDDEGLRFEMLVDLCGVDYLGFGVAEWQTEDATDQGFSRAAQRATIIPDPDESYPPQRFAVTYHLLSLSLNHRLRLRCFTGDANPPMLPSVTTIWQSADWYEREAFDLFGILFAGHPDLRRLLTDYGFIGHPFRKDFPVSGNLEVRYDPEQGRVVYQPVSIEPRTLVPRVIRDDNRYTASLKDRPPGA